VETFSPYRDAAPSQAIELQELHTSAEGPQRGAQGSTKERKRRKKLEQLREADEMKFSHSLQFNAVPDWSNHYIAYSNLKKQYVPNIPTNLGRPARWNADGYRPTASTA
jgi:hypothetical protein